MSSNTTHSRGFTLIELIIGISIIAILSVAVIAGLDPIERINQSRDTATRSIVQDIHKAVISYLGTREAYPGTTLSATAPVSMNLSATSDVLAELVSSGNLPPNFINSAGVNTLTRISVHKITDAVTDEDYIITCYKPQSKQFIGAAGLFNDGTPPTSGGTCSTAGSTGRSNCLYCTQ